MSKATNLDQLKEFARRNRALAESAAAEAAGKVIVPTKVSDLQNDSGFQTEEQVNAAVSGKADKGTSLADYGIENAYTKTELDGKLSSVYKPGGSVTFAGLPAADAAHLGLVYNVTDAFTTTAEFTEGEGKTHPSGTNVVIVAGETEGEFRYDVLAGFVDLSGYVQKDGGKVLSDENYTAEEKEKLAAIEFATDEEVKAVLDEVYGPENAGV